MGNANGNASNANPNPSNTNKSSLNSVTSDENQAVTDRKFSDEPLYVVYGRPSCGYCVKAVDLLESKQLHHCKIGVEMLHQVHAGR